MYGVQIKGTGGRVTQNRESGAGHVQVAALCALVIGFDGFDSQALAFAAPALSRAWHLAPGMLGPVFGAALTGMMIGALLLGSLADRLGRRRMILVGVAIFALGALATLATGNLPELLAVRFVTGIGLGGVLPNAVALTGEHAPARLRATLVMVMFSAMSIGAALGGLLASVIISRFGWMSVFAVGGAMPLLALPVLLRWLPESPELARHEPVTDGLPLAQLFRGGRGAVTLLLWGVFFLNLLDIFFFSTIGCPPCSTPPA